MAGIDRDQLPWDKKPAWAVGLDLTVLFFDALLLGWSVAVALILAPIIYDVFDHGGYAVGLKSLFLLIAVLMITGIWFPHVLLHGKGPLVRRFFFWGGGLRDFIRFCPYWSWWGPARRNPAQAHAHADLAGDGDKFSLAPCPFHHLH
jgi:hypothetical protein